MSGPRPPGVSWYIVGGAYLLAALTWPTKISKDEKTPAEILPRFYCGVEICGGTSAEATPPAAWSGNILEQNFLTLSNTQTNMTRRCHANNPAQSGRTGPFGAACQKKAASVSKEAKSTLL